MFGIGKQKNKLDKMVYAKKYRLTVFGYTAHFDWKVLIGLFWAMLIIVASYATFIRFEINNFLEKDFSGDVELEESDDVDIEYYQKTLDRVQNRGN